jgi:hypothetical protein
MSDIKKKRTSAKMLKSKIKELENSIAILEFKLKEKEISLLPPVDQWAMDSLNKCLVEKLKKQSDEHRLATIKQFFGEIKNEG